MKTFLLSSLLGTSWALLAQATPSSTSWENLTALGILAVVVVTAVTKTLPDMTRAHNETTKAISAEFSKTVQVAFDRIDGWQKQAHEDSQNLNETLRELASRCESVVRQQEQA